eukprot:TRINITY_DN67910_c0_g1_i1.p8 TRINITY_DN67910_c0_g1~~TRINITY_DN67910_c0_g1_i1.p8  ORF type:complete len:108 (-),score=1.36 TRINITY_DN67910_c0_g1_i1:410-733(-)
MPMTASEGCCDRRAAVWAAHHPRRDEAVASDATSTRRDGENRKSHLGPPTSERSGSRELLLTTTPLSGTHPPPTLRVHGCPRELARDACIHGTRQQCAPRGRNRQDR